MYSAWGHRAKPQAFKGDFFFVPIKILRIGLRLSDNEGKTPKHFKAPSEHV